VEKALKDVGDKISEDEKKAASEAVAAVKTAMSGDDREDIERKTQALEQASTALLQKMYEQSAAAPAPGATPAEQAVTRKSLKMTCWMPSSKRSRKAIVRRPKASSGWNMSGEVSRRDRKVPAVRFYGRPHKGEQWRSRIITSS